MCKRLILVDLRMVLIYSNTPLHLSHLWGHDPEFMGVISVTQKQLKIRIKKTKAVMDHLLLYYDFIGCKMFGHMMALMLNLTYNVLTRKD